MPRTLPAGTPVLALTNNYPPHALGGYELVCEEHSGWLVEHGHPVTVLTSRHGLTVAEPDEVTGRHGERVRRVLDFHWRNFQHRRPRGPRLWAGERRQRLAVEAALAETGARAAMVWGMAGMSKSILQVLDDHDVAMVAMVEENWPVWDITADHWMRLWSPQASPLLRALRRPWRDRAAREVAPLSVDRAMERILPVHVSPQLRDEIDAAVPAWRQRGRVQPNGIRLEVFSREGDDDRPVGRPVRLLYAGRVERRKGVHTAVEALAELQRWGVECRLDVVGWRDPDYAAELAATATRLEVAQRIGWHEPVPREQLGDEYAAADVLVFPTTWNEPFGLVPLEAMAAGCVVVGTGTGGSAEHMRDGQTALLFPPQQPAALAAAVKRLVDEPGLAGRLRRAGRVEAARHDQRIQMAQLDDALAAALGGASR